MQKRDRKLSSFSERLDSHIQFHYERLVLRVQNALKELQEAEVELKELDITNPKSGVPWHLITPGYMGSSILESAEKLSDFLAVRREYQERQPSAAAGEEGR